MSEAAVFRHLAARGVLLLLLAATPAFAQSRQFEPCTDQAPADEYAVPLCADFELDLALIDAAKEGDASALALVAQRYAAADTYRERQRLASALLRRVPNDTAIWNEIYANAQLAVRFADVGGELPEGFLAWCEERGLDPDEHNWKLDGAFSVAAEDPRAHALLVQALDSEERNLAFTAASTLALQEDVASIPGIEKVLARFGSYSWSLAAVVSTMKDERAQAIAKKYLGDEDDDEP